MACRGVHFAVEADTVKLLLDAKSDSAVLDIVQEDIERKWNEEWLHQTDKSWDALHRCLGDGTLAIPNTFAPLSAAVLGGEQHYLGTDYIISLVGPERVGAVAEVRCSP